MPFFPKNAGGGGSGSTFNGGTITNPLIIDTPGIVGFTNESGLISPGGMTLQNGAKAVERFSIVTPTIDATVVSTTDILIVPSGFNLLLDMCSVITSSITSPGATPAQISIGDSVNGNGFYMANLPCPQAASNGVTSDVSNYWCGNGQSIAAAGTQLTLSVNVASTATAQGVYCVLQGVLIPI